MRHKREMTDGGGERERGGGEGGERESLKET